MKADINHRTFPYEYNMDFRYSQCKSDFIFNSTF